MQTSPTLLPGQALSSSGRPRLDYAAVATLAFPFMVNSAVQAVLNATDTWFIGHLSPAATSAMGAVYWPVLVCVLLFGGVGLAVQTVVAQAFGAGRYRRASQATWTAVWASMMTFPVFAVLAAGGHILFSPFGIGAQTEQLATLYWGPRMLGAPFGIALWSILGFFNGIGRPMVTLRVTACVAIANAVLNQYFIFHLKLGIAGSAWATGAAQLGGVILAMIAFLDKPTRARFKSHLTMKLKYRPLIGQLSLGLPIGVLYAADLMGFAFFQLMQVRLGVVDGASTQIVMMLTSFCYMPAIGIAMAGTTLVGQAIGAGTPDWAAKLGDGIIWLAVLYMGLSGLLLAATGPWLMPLFTNGLDPQAAAVAASGCRLLWIAAGYQIFDGLNLGSSACLRGAADVRVPSLMVLALSWGFFVPLAHSLSFKPGAGWVHWLPQFGLGAVGGWLAALAYICCLGIVLLLRWRSAAWRAVVVQIGR
ncbi:MAG: MATE family efflux transporter [Pseudomonadota bacterium]|nr:MATE family efflux transporter [Pseudomonadota bacterium]